mmetsp:Transcript_5258/g.7751  ORF Transcript_5258/g.7751 Transcript_5258/m.7751 type:complete len:283 (-) Transcript_5258:1226-2074(-)|eukprot:CAMPEP_0172417392 /NCGR_PEP_ID=MMETSP1064-20121228/3914_1 /TAXON_ID=202472 /ORGANISM="Aulacoseira subarctica , Strain CCAP 1002/5" /LENGTH=282 /DNA_ID=CAMNT_0013155695 /DNA_START=104 /DNA_END=952 /DNA_ORIENTATION=+
MSPTPQENAVHAVMILIGVCIALIPMLCERYLSRRRELSLVDAESAVHIKRRTICAQLQEYSIELTASILTCAADTNASVESKSFLWLPQAGSKAECLTLEQNLMLPPTQYQQPTILDSTAKCNNADTTSRTPAGSIAVEDHSNSIPLFYSTNNDNVSDEDVQQQQDNHNAIHSLRSVGTTTCSICLESYKIGDTVCWSSNTVCCHVFHLHCIVNWLMTTSSATTSPNNRVIVENTTTNNATLEDAAEDGAPTSDIEQDVSSSPEAYSCPCCRACFIETQIP